MIPTLAPRQTRPPRLAPLAKLPVFLDLRGRRVLLIGGGEPAVWKAELLLAAGAELVVVVKEPNPELQALLARALPSPGGKGSTATRTGWGDDPLSVADGPRGGSRVHPTPDLRSDTPPAGEGKPWNAPGERDPAGERRVEPQLQSGVVAARPRRRLERRAWSEADLDSVALVVADLEDPDEATRLAAACRARGVPLNVIDKPAFCDFQFGTIVNRSPVVVGIMTDGAAPILGQAIRRRIEAVLPASLSAWAEGAQRFRERLRALLPARQDRRQFWERFVDAAFSGPHAAGGTDHALERLAAGISDGSAPGRIGSVAIVGAGPGDPELLTLKAMRELQAADVIVYDRLVTPGILELGRREARRIHVGKEGHGAACRQDDISALLVDLALAGERVVRLKGGDPAIFGRTGEEADACRAAGVPIRIVPGVTTASAAAAALDLSLTHRGLASRVQFITGHDRRGDLPADLDLAALADPMSTLVVYMGRRTSVRLAEKLLSHSLPGTTPVLAVTDVSRPSQSVIAGDLDAMAKGLALPDGVPVIIMIGAALGATTAPISADALPQVIA